MSTVSPRPSFLRHAAVFGLGNLLMYAASFMLLPLYTRWLAPTEYGVLEVLNRLGEVGMLFLLFGAVRQAALAFHRHSDDEAEQRCVAGTVVTMLLIEWALGGVLLLTAAAPLAALLGIGDVELVRIALAAALLESSVLVLLGLSHARLESAFIVRVNFGLLVVRVALSVALVVGLEWGIRGVLLASVGTSGLFAAGLVLREARRNGLAWDGAKLREMAWFVLPFLPGGLSMFVLNNGDRFLVLHWVGEEAVGVYSLGYKLAAMAYTFSAGPLLMVWGAQMYASARQEDAPQVFGRVTTWIFAVHVFFGLGLCLFQDEVVAVLGGSRYAEAATVIAPVTLAYALVTLVTLGDAGFYIRRQTVLKTGIALASVVVAIGMYAWLIPIWGGLGAAWATVAAFAFQAGLTARVSGRIFPVNYEPVRLAILLALAIGLWLPSRLLPVGSWSLPVKALLGLLWPITAWLTGLMTPVEKETVRSAVRNVLQAVWPTPTPQASNVEACFQTSGEGR